MVKISLPIITQIRPFDKKKEQVFSFRYDGSQVFKNRLVIKNNLTNVVVYDQTISSFQLNHPLPSDSIPSNGITYSATISVFDVNNMESQMSNSIIFYCFSEPNFSINILNEQIIRSSNFTVEVSYSQIENELLSSFQLRLYDTSQSQIYLSDELFAANTLSSVISGLASDTFYYIRCTGTTVNGMLLDTGMIQFSVSYLQPSSFSIVEVTNLPRQAMTKISSHMTSITGKSNPSPPIYINDTEVDLTTSNSKVYFEKEFSVDGNLTIESIGRNFTPYKTIIIPEGKKKIEITHMIGVFNETIGEQSYFVLSAYNSFTHYRSVSNIINIPTPEQKLCILIGRKNNLYEISVSLVD